MRLRRSKERAAGWEDGRLTLHFAPYKFEQTAEKIRTLDIPGSIRERLVEVLQMGSLSGADQPNAREKRARSAT